MKLSVILSASDCSRHISFDIKSDFGLSKKEWNALSDNEKTRIIQEQVDELPEHPYWCVDTFEEK